MVKHSMTSLDGEKGILEINWNPKTCSIKFEFRIFDPNDPNLIKFSSGTVIKDISKELRKLAFKPQKRP